MFIYSEDGKLSKQFPYLKKCLDCACATLCEPVSTMLNHRGNEEGSLVNSTLGQAIRYLMKDGLIASIVNSIVMNNRLNKICRDLDTIGIEKNFLKHINVWNFINEKEYWVDYSQHNRALSLTSSESDVYLSDPDNDVTQNSTSTCAYCNNPNCSRRKVLNRTNQDFNSGRIDSVRSHLQSTVDNQNWLNDETNLMTRTKTCRNENCRTNKKITSCNTSVYSRQKFDQTNFANNWENKTLKIVVSDLNNCQKVEQYPLPCTSESLICLIVKYDTSAITADGKNKYEVGLNKTCAFINDILGQLDRNTVSRCRLICKIQEDSIFFKLKKRERNGCQTNLFIDQLKVSKRNSLDKKSSTLDDNNFIDLNKNIEQVSEEILRINNSSDFTSMKQFEENIELRDTTEEKYMVDTQTIVSDNFQSTTSVVDYKTPLDYEVEQPNHPANENCCNCSVNYLSSLKNSVVALDACDSRYTCNLNSHEEIFDTARNSTTMYEENLQEKSDEVLISIADYTSPNQPLKSAVDISTIASFNSAHFQESSITTIPNELSVEDNKKTSSAQTLNIDEMTINPLEVNKSSSINAHDIVQKESKIAEVINELSDEQDDNCTISVQTTEYDSSTGSRINSKILIIPVLSGVSLRSNITKIMSPVNSVPIVDERCNQSICEECECDKIFKIKQSQEILTQKPVIELTQTPSSLILPEVINNKEDIKSLVKEKNSSELTKTIDEHSIISQCKKPCHRSTSMSQLSKKSLKTTVPIKLSSKKSESACTMSERLSAAEANYGSSRRYSTGDSSMNNLYSACISELHSEIFQCHRPKTIKRRPQRYLTKESIYHYLPHINKRPRAIMSAILRSFRNAFSHKTLHKLKYFVPNKFHRLLMEREKATNTSQQCVRTNKYRSQLNNHTTPLRRYEETRSYCNGPPMCCCTSNIISQTISSTRQSKQQRDSDKNNYGRDCLNWYQQRHVKNHPAKSASGVINEYRQICHCTHCKDLINSQEPIVKRQAIISCQSISISSIDDESQQLSYQRKYQRQRHSTQSVASTTSNPYFCCYHKIFADKNLTHYLNTPFSHQRSISDSFDANNCGECFDSNDYDIRSMLSQYVNLCKSVKYSLMKELKNNNDIYEGSDCASLQH